MKDVIRESQRKAKRGIAATAMDEEEDEEPQERKRAKIEPEPPKPEEVVEPVVEPVEGTGAEPVGDRRLSLITCNKDRLVP